MLQDSCTNSEKAFYFTDLVIFINHVHYTFTNYLSPLLSFKYAQVSSVNVLCLKRAQKLCMVSFYVRSETDNVEFTRFNSEHKKVKHYIIM